MTTDPRTMAGVRAGGLPSNPFGIPDEPWVADGLCSQVDADMFFPEKGGSTKEAKSICARCEVREECLSYAMANDERFGIWGGYSERERRKLKRGAA